MASVKIKEIVVYHPEKMVTNEELAKGLKDQAESMIDLWRYFGRDKRYLSGNGENTLEMAIKASRKLLRETGLSGSDIDMIVVSSGTHEYNIPTDASFVHQAIFGKNECVIYDTNANCVGMVVAFDHISRMMMQNPKMKYALLVGSEQLSLFYGENDIASLGLCGDAACAVLLERVEGEGLGFMDSVYFTSTEKPEDLRLPGNGFSKSIVPGSDNKIYLADGYNVDLAFPTASANINKMLAENGVTKSQVSAYMLSQLNVNVIYRIADDLEDDIEKFPYIGDRYGYTGTSSPFIALYHAMGDKKLREGDLFVLWSVGAGITSCGVLARL
ncbi:ketoacyl-ACP synthase III (plasmid) [Paenibacillus thiaminolyticus]|uniref:ketoacyl-ACP synthase III n=1 Tax=Paenibacillus thiaminolyticus TaxID=49283 RepID=UPI002330E2B5|nr:ketoacyl-ACP synthase III [Paenibacillus thiaminolyticus]WCF11707.1 ketoacyl-ACP synthase III [Paenibacillus thiaminolyticus]